MQFTDEQLEAAEDAIYHAIISNPRNPNSARIDSITADETIYTYLARLALRAIPEPVAQPPAPQRVKILAGSKTGQEFPAKRNGEGWSVDVGGGYPTQYYGDHEVEVLRGHLPLALLGSRWRSRGWADAPVLTIEEVIFSVNRKPAVRLSEPAFDGRCETIRWAVDDLDVAFVRV